jgi:hypothetical protein
MAKITAPVEGFTGTSVGVAFTDGVGETEDPVKLAYFERHGYGVGEDGVPVSQAPAPVVEPDPAAVPDPAPAPAPQAQASAPDPQVASPVVGSAPVAPVAE